jgi:uncharacterized membrane protein YfcA
VGFARHPDFRGQVMSAAAAAFLLAAVFVTALISGVFGMAGGLLMMGALGLVLPVSAAFVTHGVIQLVANGWRAALHRAHIRWRVIGFYAVGAVAAALAAAVIALVPSKPLLYLLLGLVAFLVWIPKKSLQLDAARPTHAVFCGAGVTGLNLTAGVAGPLLDVFFVRTEMTRHQIVSTKAATQTLSHLAKIIVYGAPLAADGADGLPPIWLFAAAIPLSILATVMGGRILDRMTDRGFLAWTRWIVTAAGVLYLARAAQLWFSGGAP